jgi:hypothetical protein
VVSLGIFSVVPSDKTMCPEVDSASESEISLGGKAVGATLVVPKVEKIRGLNLPGTPRATSACRGILLLYC